MDITVVLPSYKPDEKLLSTVEELEAAGFDDIIVVDDGGGEEYRKYFDILRDNANCTVLTHTENRGKGAALKTAFKWYLENKKWWQDIISGEYQNYYQKMYGNR